MGLSSGSVSHLCLYRSFKATYSSRWRAVPPPLPQHETVKINDSYYVIIHGFRKYRVPSGFFKLSLAVSNDHGPRHPFICTIGSLQGSSLWFSCSCSVLGAHSLKYTTAQLFPSIPGIPSVATTSKKVERKNIKAETCCQQGHRK